MAESGKAAGGRIRSVTTARSTKTAGSAAASGGPTSRGTGARSTARTGTSKAKTTAPARIAARTVVAPPPGGIHTPSTYLVRPGEDAWTEDELREVREGLIDEVARLGTEIRYAEHEIADMLRDSGDGAGDDQADAGTKNFEREHEMALTNQTRGMLSQSERALRRLADGTYGACESCGSAIGKARLQVFPRATLCVACKEREERR
ncbi:TraR/DksA family transcriptional regulator [Yinghuangia sp. ASG 101]|uniref:TraR/DksA family transcriptional regulator n=1 Tax=Yinghuangia sp. ASG 101 TaxID=2896848 RepID=UPI001E56067E|nr:TraR/DksA family transcriptional regulator [Yinghuangia sp. ASG 101]UGQ15569.1 TraR/DksA family transcriptional regulator [Yinghuangia sp. ASG 101]